MTFDFYINGVKKLQALLQTVLFYLPHVKPYII